MKKSKMITKINGLIKKHKLDFDPAVDDTSVADLKALLSDVNDAVAEATAPPTFKLSELVAELEKDPKTIRARFRRLDNNNDESLPPTVEGAKQRWTFLEKHRKAVTALVVNAE